MAQPADTGFYLDVYGRKRDLSTKRAIFEEYSADHPFMGSDALVIAEFFNHWGYIVPSLPISESGTDKNGHDFPTSLIVTSPNMGYIPDITKGRLTVQAHADGRYGLADFSLCPQWYFQGTYYLPYIRRRPADIEKDELGKIWYDLKISDFVLEKGGLFAGLGRIRKELAAEFITLRKALTAKIKVLESDTRFSGIDRAELLYAKQAMQFASIILQCAPQTFELTLLTVTGFQRHFLEALACYEYLTVYRDMDYEDGEGGDSTIAADTSLMGAFTTSVEVAEKFYRQKVPVWLVRVPAHVSLTTSIVASVYPTLLDNINPNFLPNSQPVYTGHASAIRNRACQALKVGNIRLGHGAYTVQPGDFNAQFVPEEELRNVYTAPIAQSSSQRTSSSQPSTSSITLMPQAQPSSHSSHSSQPSTSSITPTPQIQPLSQPSANSSQTQSTGASSESGGFRPQWQTIPTRLAVNKDKFIVSSLPLFPSANHVWVQALRRVTQSWRRILNHANLHVLRSYGFPDPNIFLKESSLTLQGKVYALGWLAIRSRWIARMADVTAGQFNYPKPQEWRDLIGVDIARSLGFSDRIKESIQSSNKRQKMTASVRDTLGIDWSSLRESPDIYWKGTLICPGGMTRLENFVLSPTIYKEVIWDVMEHNFRLELLALDRSIFPRDYLSSLDASSRDEMVTACLPNQHLFCVDWPVHDEGLGAKKWEDRMEYVEAFRVLLSTWPGSVCSALKSLRPIVRHNGSTFTGQESAVLAVESLAYPFYCQTFFDYFGRAPSIPFNCPL